MFETRFVLRPTKFAMETEHRQRGYLDCWQGLTKNFAPR
jgi:homogentisate 1,2-dioxygenase